MNNSIDLSNTRIITVSGRIATGATTLAKHLAEKLNWQLLEGGELFKKIHEELNVSETEVNARPDNFDLSYEEKIKKILHEQNHYVIQSHLAGFDAQGIPDVFKILVVCEDENGNDKTDIRIDRLVNRDNIPTLAAKQEIKERERQHLEKFRRLYVNNNPDWVYWDKKYYDLVIDTYDHNQEEALKIALVKIGYK